MARKTTAERRIHNIWLFYKGYSDKFYALFVSVCAAFWGVFLPDVPEEYSWHWWITDVGIAPNIFLGLVILFGLLWGHSVFKLQRPSYGELVRKESQASQSSQEKAAAIESTLTSVMRQLAIHCNANTDRHRVTAYFRHAGKFVAVARYSSNPVNGSISQDRSQHQEDLGVISQAWSASEAYRVDLPQDRVEWEEKICSIYGYSEEQAAAFRMQSLSYAAIRIGSADRSVGVLVMESTSARGVKSTTLSEMRGSLVQAALAEMIAAHAKHTPQIERLDNEDEEAASGAITQPRWKANKVNQEKKDLVRQA